MSRIGLGLLLILSVMTTASEYDDWLNAQIEEFDSFQSELDKEFSNWIKADWQTSIIAMETKTSKPKPVEPTVIPKNNSVADPRPLEQQSIELPEQRLQFPALIPDNEVLPFLGNNYSIEKVNWPKIDTRIKSKQQIATIWQLFASSDYSKLLLDFEKISGDDSFSGWDQLLFTETYSRQVYKTKDQQIILTWFLMLKSNHLVRLGFSPDNQLLLMYASDVDVYDVPYSQFNGRKYYVYANQHKLSTIKSYKGQHGSATKLLDVIASSNLQVGGEWWHRQIGFLVADKHYEIKVPINDNLIAQLSTYPQVSLAQFLNRGMDERLTKSLVSQIEQMTASLNDQDTINFILAMVQQLTAYKTDDQQFGEENYLVAMESLYYGYSDCEDRSYLMVHLLKALGVKEVSFLDFPGHIAVGIASNSPGVHYLLGEKRYVIADPTYINASFGMLMPKYVGYTPKIFPMQ